MKVLDITINNNVVARISGENFDHPTARTRWTRYSSVDLRLADGTFLHFDAEPVTNDGAPETNVENADRNSTLLFNQLTGSQNPDIWEIGQVDPFFILVFRWRNPLTPMSRGMWVRLLLQRRNQQLIVSQADSPHDTRVWSFSRDKNKWKDVRVLTTFSNGIDVTALMQRLQDLEYVDDDGSGCELLTRAGDAKWLVDASHVDKIRKNFHLVFLPPANGIRPLAARFAAPAAAYPVSNAALGSEAVAATALEANTIDLTCARRDLGEGEARFILEWTNVAAGNGFREQLSLDALYNALARHYALGLASARSRNRLSFAPTRLLAPAVRVHFDVDADGTRLRQILVDQNTQVTWITGAASETGGDPVALTFRQEAAAVSLRDAIARDAEAPLELLPTMGPGIAVRGGGWVVNGVIVNVRKFERASLKIAAIADDRRYGQPPISVDFRLDFSEGSLRPVSDDPEIGFETLSASLHRERPIVIDLSDDPAVRIAVRETADAEQSRLLRIDVTSIDEQPKDYVIDAVVLDPSPLTAARVRSRTSIDPRGLIAEYTDDSDQVPEWDFASGEGEMDVVLPPQVIGEEMVKGRLYDGGGEEVPAVTEPFDFRLSPPARLVLDRTDIDTARALAPWSLRRLLGQRPGVVGAKLQKAQFELLYGLLTSIDGVEALRVAELDALIGRIPFPDQLLDLLRAAQRPASHSATPVVDRLRSRHAAEIAKFIRGMLYRSSWWPIFRDFTSRQQLTITGKGVSTELRRGRATADPFKLDRPADPTSHDGRKPLRGGVDWPFQSQSVYGELTAQPTSSSTAVEGLAFGTLGGTGKQTAEFNNGKTLIISETTQGRLDSVTVIRIGRIAMLWNRARHVIVYERSTRVAPRYANLDNKPDDGIDSLEFQSPAFDGLAALRKVREYVEITEPARSYPDTSTSRPINGPLVQSFFETTIIPVKSSWGRDVSSGFVIALRGPLAESEQKFFPFPKIFLKCARARGKGEGLIGHQLKDPAELLFYTSTRADDGGDSDLWPAVADIDFPLIRPKTAPVPLPFAPRFPRARKQPDARPADFGQGRFTVTLDPPEEAVDLMHGRLSDGIEARVASMSLARGRLSDRAGVAVDTFTAKLGEPMAAGHARLHDGLSELRMQVAQARAGGVHTLAEIPAFAAEARNVVGKLQGEAATLGEALRQKAPPAFQWDVEQGQWNDKFVAKVPQLTETWRRQLDLTAVTQDVARVGRSALETVCQQVHQRIDEASFLPFEAMNRIDIAQQALQKRARVLVDDVSAGFDAAVDRLHARYDEILDSVADVPENDDETADDGVPVAGLTALQAEVDAVLDGFLAALTRFDTDALKHLTDTLGEWFSGNGLVGTLAAIIRELTGDVRALAEEIIAAVPPVSIDEPNWQQVKDDSRQLLEDFSDSLAAAIAEPVKELRDTIETLLDATTRKLTALQEANKAVNDACKTAAGLLDTDAGAAIKGFLDTGDTTLRGIPGRFKTAFDTLQTTKWASVPGSFNDAAGFIANIDGFFDSLRGGLATDLPLDAVERAVTDAAKTIADSLEGTARQVERAIAGELRDLETAASGAALELTRALATGPINDAIACTRDFLGYYYDAASDALQLTRATALFNDLGQSVLNSLSTALPFDKIRDRLLPQLDGVDLSQLLPDFGGLKLEYLFPDLKAPNDGSDNDWIHIRHGFDKDRLTAFASVDIDKVIEGQPEVFVLPPVSLKLDQPRFVASSRLELSSGGGKSQSTKASLQADWMLCLSDRPIVTMHDATLRYDSDGGFDFSFDSEKVELAPEFQFITQALRNLLPDDEGVTLTPLMPAGIRAELGLPLPDLTTGAFTLTGITLYAFMELLIADGFEVRTGFWLSKPERPFGLAVLFLGGGGWVGMEASYRPPDRFVTRVSIGISAGAFVAVNFGVARGSAGILFTAGVDFYRNWQTQGGTTLITLGILVWGEFSILGIASASLRLSLSITYNADTGEMIGRGRIDYSIKICWCFTLHVSQEVQQRFAGGRSQHQQVAATGGTGPDIYSKAVRAVHSNVAL